MGESGHVLTVKEAAALARVSPATIRRWCRRGYLTAFQVGRGATIRIPRDELRELVGRRSEYGLVRHEAYGGPVP